MQLPHSRAPLTETTWQDCSCRGFAARPTHYSGHRSLAPGPTCYKKPDGPLNPEANKGGSGPQRPSCTNNQHPNGFAARVRHNQILPRRANGLGKQTWLFGPPMPHLNDATRKGEKMSVIHVICHAVGRLLVGWSIYIKATCYPITNTHSRTRVRMLHYTSNLQAARRSIYACRKGSHRHRELVGFNHINTTQHCRQKITVLDARKPVDIDLS